MRKFAFYLAIALAVVSALVGVRSVTLLNQPELDSDPDAWVGLEGGSLTLVGAAGEPIAFRLESVSISGLWASPTGLSLTLEEPRSNFRVTVPVVAPRSREWGDAIGVSGQSDDRGLSIPVSFQIPSNPDLVHRTLDGVITGTVEVPRRSFEAVQGRGGLRFKNHVVQLWKPIRVSVVPPGESPRSRAASRRRIEVVLSVVAFVGFAGAGAYLRFRTSTA
jgi:hypothetical protein